MEEAALVRTIVDSLEVPHTELSSKGSVLSLREKERKDLTDQSIGGMNDEASSVAHPRYDMLEALSLDIFHHVMKSFGELERSSLLSFVVVSFVVVSFVVVVCILLCHVVVCCLLY